MNGSIHPENSPTYCIGLQKPGQSAQGALERRFELTPLVIRDARCFTNISAARSVIITENTVRRVGVRLSPEGQVGFWLGNWQIQSITLT